VACRPAVDDGAELRDAERVRDLAGEPVVSTLNLMATGAVQTPGGTVIPQERFFCHRERDRQQLPSAGRPFVLQRGLNRLAFTGQFLIDWDLIVDSPDVAEALVGNWGHDWHPAVEQRQFAEAHGRPFEERQHILRVKGRDRLRMIILPRRKGEHTQAVTAGEDGMTISGGGTRCTITDHGIVCRRDGYLSVTALTDTPVGGDGFVIPAGPAEITVGSATGTVAIAGEAGQRRLVMPAGWTFKDHPAVGGGDGSWTVRHDGRGVLHLEVEKPSN
jgi:hypothetical protein